MSFITVVSLDTNFKSLKGYLDTGGYTLFNSHAEDQTYFILQQQVQSIFPYISPQSLMSDPRLLNFGRILTYNEFLTLCDNEGNSITNKPTTSEPWIAAYYSGSSIIAYTEENKKIQVNDSPTKTEIENFTNYLYGGKVLESWEADLHRLEERFYELPTEPYTDTDFIFISLGSTVPFQRSTSVVDSAFLDFLQLSSDVITETLLSINTPLEEKPVIAEPLTTQELWKIYFENDIVLEDYKDIYTPLIAEEE